MCSNFFLVGAFQPGGKLINIWELKEGSLTLRKQTVHKSQGVPEIDEINKTPLQGYIRSNAYYRDKISQAALKDTLSPNYHAFSKSCKTPEFQFS